MALLKLLFTFAPWISFLIIAQDSLLRVKIGLVVALVMTIAMSLAGLQKGIIRWATVLFFVYATVAIVGFDHAWTLQYLGVLANAALAIPAWFTIVFKEPFTLAYAKAQTDPAYWNDPRFIRSNYIITSIWAVTFTLCTVMSYFKMRELFLPAMDYVIVSYSIMLLACVFSTWYPSHLKKKAAAFAAAQTASAGKVKSG